MKTLFGTTALVLTMALPAVAQDMATPYLPGINQGVRASDFIGKRVYVTETDVVGMNETAIASANADWEDAGEISDLIISMAGDSEAVLVDFGGFLGMGEKTVAVSMADLVMVPDSASPDDYFIVFQGSKASLEGAPAYDAAMVFDAPEGGLSDTTAAPAAGDPLMETVGTDMAPADGTAPAADTMMADGTMVDYALMTESDLVGTRVYGPNDEDVGEISAVTLGEDGKINAAVIDVGGFIGIGEKPVALGADALTMTPAADGGEAVLRINMTQEQLESLPTHEG